MKAGGGVGERKARVGGWLQVSLTKLALSKVFQNSFSVTIPVFSMV